MKWDRTSPSSEQDPAPAGTMAGHCGKPRNESGIRTITPHRVKQWPSKRWLCWHVFPQKTVSVYEAAVCAALLTSFPSPAGSLWRPNYKYTRRDTDTVVWVPGEKRWGMWTKRSAWSTTLPCLHRQRTREAAWPAGRCVLARSHSGSRGQQVRLSWPCTFCPRCGHVS